MFEGRVYCGELRADDVDREVTLAGWLDTKRDLGGILFIELRDVTGIVQLVFDESHNRENVELADSARNEYTLLVKGKVRRRSEETVNPEVPTGEIEVVADTIEILSESEVPPFPLDTRDQLSEEVRLKYRFIDLRRDDMKNALIARHRATQAVRSCLNEKRFLEIETPILNKSTPEGARDFLVPSRINRGEFYALPQSPQLFKQILMISGYDRYYQVVRCFRDEDLRNDRQPEFTQVDLEMSFVTPGMVMETIEELLIQVVREVTGREVVAGFSRMTYDEAMDRYGCDAPDTRYGLEIRGCDDIFRNSSFRVFSAGLEQGHEIRAFTVQDHGAISRKMIDDYTEMVSIYGAKGFPNVRYTGAGFEGGIAKFLSEEEQQGLIERFNLEEGSTIFFSVDRRHIVDHTLANMREKIASDLDLIDPDELSFVWITDFPLFERDHETGQLHAKHHPFTAPHPEDLPMLDADKLESVRSLAYDIVLNGVEIGGGSIRIHRSDLQEKVLGLLGVGEEEAREKFSFLLDALRYGAPPHGGIALGLDRVLMILLGRTSIRDVMAFPKTQRGQCLMSGAPSGVAPEQLRELYLKVVER
jgi:aspartyl-tRNA synthetase